MTAPPCITTAPYVKECCQLLATNKYNESLVYNVIEVLLQLDPGSAICELDKKTPGLVSTVLSAISNESFNHKVKDNCLKLLINMSADDERLSTTLVDEYGVYTILFPLLLDPNSHVAGNCSDLMANLSRYDSTAKQLWMDMAEAACSVERLSELLCQKNYNRHSCDVDSVAFILQNLCIVQEVRTAFMNNHPNTVIKLLTFLSSKFCDKRRQGVSSMLKNLTFDANLHEWLLSDEVQIATHLLKPLTGATEHLTDEENDQLPLDLQYLPEGTARESLSEVRITLLESLFRVSFRKAAKPGPIATEANMISPLLNGH